MTTKTFQHIVKKEKIDYFQIPKGILSIKEWTVCTQFKQNSSIKFTLYYIPEGKRKKNEWKVLDVVYTKFGNYRRVFETPIQVLSPKGNAEIAMKALVLGEQGKREVFMKWQGDLS